MFGFEDLAEIVFREDDGVLLGGAMEDGVANIDQVRTEGKVGAVLFDDAEGEDADALGLVKGGDEISGGEFLPFHGEVRGEEMGSEKEEEGEEGGAGVSHGVKFITAKWGDGAAAGQCSTKRMATRFLYTCD